MLFHVFHRVITTPTIKQITEQASGFVDVRDSRKDLNISISYYTYARFTSKAIFTLPPNRMGSSVLKAQRIGNKTIK